MFGDGSPLSLQGVAHSGGGCAAWLRNGTFAYRFGGSGYFDGWYQPDVWVEGYRTSYAPSLPVDLMSASSAISEAQQKLAEEEDNIQSALDRIEDSLPQWTSRVGEYSKLAKFLNERLEWPNVAQKILEANQQSERDRVRAFWGHVPVYGKYWGNLGMMGLGLWRDMKEGGRDAINNFSLTPRFVEDPRYLIPGYGAVADASSFVETGYNAMEKLGEGGWNVVEGSLSGNQLQTDLGLEATGSGGAQTLVFLYGANETMKSFGPSSKQCHSWCFTAGTLVAVSGGFKPIEDIRIGDRVESTDGTHDLTEIDEKTWKHISVRMSNSDGSGDVLDIELLRSPKWIEESGCQVGASIGLAVPELGIAGWARVLAVEPCPKLQTGSGRVVTMTITHFNSFVLQFKLEGLSEVLEPTQTHPLYSEDRGGWVHAGELKVGELLRTKTGPARIEAITHKEGTYRVYNFEVEGTHAYYTSAIRVLSHNSVADNCAPTSLNPEEINFSQRNVGHKAWEYAGKMERGEWNWARTDAPPTVMKVGEKWVTYDNRRVLAARAAGLPEIPVRVVKPQSPGPRGYKTWEDAFAARRTDPRNFRSVPEEGLCNPPLVRPKGKK